MEATRSRGVSLSSTPEPASGGAPSVPAASPPAAAIEGTATIGQSVVIKGELAASEDLTTEGRIEGKIALQQHVVTIGRSATVRGQVVAREVIILGHVVGDINATDKVIIRESGNVEGDVVSPIVAIADGAHFRGRIDMQGGAVERGRATSGKTATIATLPPALEVQRRGAKSAICGTVNQDRPESAAGDPRVSALLSLRRPAWVGDVTQYYFRAP